jgi:rare lipoprotein A
MPFICRISVASHRSTVRFLGLTLAAASLAACAQSQVVSRRSEFSSPAVRQAAIQHHYRTRVATTAPVSIVRRHATASTEHVSIVRRHDTAATGENALGLKLASHGVASFYTEGTQTASGERYNPSELTAAHPTLPFGTKLRVTNTTTGRSVTVRVNDRGPYVAGRVVDVSYSAASALGMVGAGTAKVKLDVVQ